MSRFYGRVKTFFLDRKEGYIVELGEVGSLSQDNVVTDRDVYFRASQLRVTDPRSIVCKATTGDIVEYERQTDDRGRHRAYDITGLHETRLPCEEGLVVFKRWHDIHREALRREGQRAINQYLHQRQPQKRNRRRDSRPSYNREDDRRDHYDSRSPSPAFSSQSPRAVSED